MTNRLTETSVDSSSSGPAKTILILGMLSLAVYGLIVWLSSRFAYGSQETDRPIIWVLVLFATVFLFYAFAIRVAGKSSNKQTIWAVVVFAVLFRLVVSISTPIQEVDLYRYLWDGVVSAEGVSPFRYAPELVKQAPLHSQTLPDFQKLTELVEGDDAIKEVLNRIHFAHVPTVYPPTSQAVFFATAVVTPDSSSVWFRVWMMKFVLIGFDLATLILVIKILRVCTLPLGLSVAYAWCPLLLKEVANSGHLDTIAVFLTTAAVYLLIRTLDHRVASVSNRPTDDPPGILLLISMMGVAVLLALAVGAKLYPIVLCPLVFFLTVRRFGFLTATIPVAVFIATTIVVMWPMFGTAKNEPPHVLESGRPGLPTMLASAPMVEAPTNGMPTSDPSEGLKTFLKYWEMNDFLFLIVVENLKPARGFPNDTPIWFSVLPEVSRQQASDFALTRLNSQYFEFSSNEAPFVFTRLITTTAFLLIALGLAWRAAKSASPGVVCETVFLTLAWFWLLSPTQNPWYWLWALPFLPVMRNRAWFAVSGLVMVYYLRFWLGYHFGETQIWGSQFQGTQYFDFVVTWFEFGPLLVWLAIEGWFSRKVS